MQYAPGRLLSPIAGGGTPSLDMNFLTATADTLDSRVTFSRAGMAWQYDSTGTLVTAPHNLLVESQSFDATWTKTNCTVTANTAVSPLGATTADLVTGTSATVHVSIGSVTVPLGARVVVSIYAKTGPAANTFMRLRVGGGAEVASQWVNLATGGIGGTTSSANIVITSPTATDAGSGWWRVSAVFTTATFTSLSIGAGPALANSNGGTTGDTAYFWGAQAEIHTAVRPYLNTTVRNLLGYSEQLDNVVWTKSGCAVTANYAASPSGLTDADRIVPTASTATFIELQQNFTAVLGTTYAFSAYVKASGYSYVQLLGASTAFGTFAVNYDLSTGTETAYTAGTSTIIGRSITDVGNGWYRVYVSATALAAGTTRLGLDIIPASGSARGVSWTPNGTDGVLMWGAQLASAGSLTTYVPTIAAASSSAAYYGPRFGYDPVALTARGLLIEEARTNQMPGTMTGGTYWQGAATTVATGATAPDGTTNGVTLTQSAGGAITYGASPLVGVFGTITASTPTTASIFAKAGTCTFLRMFLTDNNTPTISSVVWFNLGAGTIGTTTNSGGPTSTSSTITSVGNGWYRCTITATLGSATTATILIRMASADAVTTDVGSKVFSVFNPQLEAGAFATSPILTTTAAASRAAETAIIQPLGSWYNAAAGTLFVEATSTNLQTSSTAVGVHDGTGNNLMTLRFRSGAPLLAASVTTGGAAQITISGTPPYTTGAVAKLALAYQTDDIASYYNGAVGVTDTLATIPTVTTLQIGGRNGGAEPLNGYIRRVKVYNSRLPNSTLQVITS
jgi:hypothetical protein